MSDLAAPVASHTAFTELPVVDVSALVDAASTPGQRKGAADALGRAAREVGFLYITGHGIAGQVIDDLKAQTAAYFAQPLDRKMRDYIGNSVNHSGYVPEGEEQPNPDSVDLKEAYDVGYDLQDSRLQRPMLGPNQWPELAGFREAISCYYHAALNLGNALFRGFALALGLEEERFLRQVNHPPSQLRLIHYPFNPRMSADRPGIGAHTDYECFTILLPTAPGLEVLNGAGEWIDVPLLENAFVINIGDMLEALSNGAFAATSHRVRKVAQERYSFPLFCSMDYDTLIEPLPEFVNDAQPPRYPRLVAGEHLYAQTIQTFAYLKKRLAEGRISLPEGSRGVGSFGKYGGAP